MTLPRARDHLKLARPPPPRYDPRMLLISGGTLVTLGTPNRVLTGHAVLLDGDRVVALAPERELLARHPARCGAMRIDAHGQLVMPGLVCAHHHLYSTFARGAPLASFSPRSFLEILQGLWWKLDLVLAPGDLRLSALPVLMDALRAGTTTLIDHHESQGYQEGALDEIAGACREVGVRACLTLGASDRLGRGAAGLEENRRFMAASRSAPGDLVRAMVGLHAPFTVEDDTLAGAVALAREHAVGLHIHVAEDRADQDHSLARFGMRAIERLSRAQALDGRTLIAHAIHLDAAERERVTAAGSWILHNPESNMNNAVGAADVVGLMGQKINVALGTDGMSSDMRAQARAAFLLQRHLHQDPRVAWMESLALLVENNARLASAIWGRPVGSLEEGGVGDVVLYDYDPPTPLTADNFGGHLLFGILGARVTTTIVAGVVRHDRGTFTSVDAAAVGAAARVAAKAFWQRFSATADVHSKV